MMASVQEELGQPSSPRQGNSHSGEEKVREPAAQKDEKRKRWWNVWKKWEGNDSDWWFASTGIPVSDDLH
jgi:potassium channel subfamily K